MSPFVFLAATLDRTIGQVPKDQRQVVQDVVDFLRFMAKELPDLKHTEPVILVALARCATHHELRPLFAAVLAKMDTIISEQYEAAEGG